MKGLLPLCLLALMPLKANAQRLHVAKTTIDVGRTGYEIPVTATFEIRNKGLRRLKIEKVLPDCNCTTVEFPREEIGIGDKAVIKMTYDARQLGHFNKQAAIISNADRKPLYITMTGLVLADYEDNSGAYPYEFDGLLADRAELEFDNVSKGEHPTMELHLFNNGSTVVQPTLMHLPLYLQATTIPERLQPGQKGVIQLTLDSERLPGYGLTQSSVYLGHELGEKVTDDTEMSLSVVLLPDVSALSTSRAPGLALSDTTLMLDFGGKPKKTGYVTITNAGHGDLRITSLQMFTRGLKVTLGRTVLSPGTSTKLKVTGEAAVLGKVRTRPRILMITNDPRQPKVVVNVTPKP